MLLIRERTVAPEYGVLPDNRTAYQGRSVVVASIQPLRQLCCKPSCLQYQPQGRCAPRHPSGGGVCCAAACGDSSTDDRVSFIRTSLANLQHLVSNLDTEASADGLLTAYQQLRYIHQKVLQEQRRQQTAIARSKWRSRQETCKAPATKPTAHGQQSTHHDMLPRSEQHGAAASPEQIEPGASGTSCSTEAAAAALVEAKQLRQRCDDAQDYLLSLLQLHLQDAPPRGVIDLLTSAAYRQLNVTAINQTCVNVFLEKQADASPADMAALMRALALVRCCSRGSHGVEGLNHSQLAALFAGTMSHLIAHVDKALQQNSYSQHQPQDLQTLQQCTMPNTSTSSRRRRSVPAGAASSSIIMPMKSQPVDPAADLQREVAAAVAAHVSGRVPLSSALIPHILRLLGDQAPAWLHPITDLQTVSSVKQLQDMISHPCRYDYTYLAAALHKLAELTEQQQHVDASQHTVPKEAVGSELLLAGRLARKLFGWLQHLQADASAAELVCVLAAAARMGVTDGKVYAAAAMQFVDGPQLQPATDAHIASVMYAVACFSSSSSGGSSEASFGRQQQQYVLKQCAYNMTIRIKQQQSQQQQVVSSVHTANVVMAVWALATAGLRIPKVITSRLFDFLAAGSSIQSLLGSAADTGVRTTQQQQQQVGLQEAARNSCTVLWAAAQLQYTGNMPMIRTYLAAFMTALPAVPLTCNSVTTVLQALGTILAAQQQQQGQGDDMEYWRSVFLRCTDSVLQRLQQQQQSAQSSIGGAANTSAAVVETAAAAAADGVCGVTAACQLVWAHQAAGMTLPDRPLMQLLDLLQHQAPAWLLETAISRADSPQAILKLLQSPAAAAVDLACIAAAFNRLVTLRDQQSLINGSNSGSSSKSLRMTAAGAATQPQQGLNTKAYSKLIKDCAKQVSSCAEAAGVHLLRHQQQQQGQQVSDEAQAWHQEQVHQQQQGPSPAALATATSDVLWATARLQHKDNRLCSRCMQLFHSVAQSASAEAAAAVVNAMAAAGRGLRALYGDQEVQLLQEVVRVCTDKLLSDQTPTDHRKGIKHRKQRDSGGSAARSAEVTAVDASLLSIEVAQNVLQLHAVLQIKPSQQHLCALLTALTDEKALAAMKDSAVTASLVAVLSSVAQLSYLPASSTVDTADSTQQAAVMQAAAVSEQQQLLQDLLMYGLIPRLAHATPKQIATSLEAIAELASAPFPAMAAVKEAVAVGPAACLLPLSLARDFARAVVSELLMMPSAATSPGPEGTEGGSAADHTVSCFSAGWKGEHLASVATSALRLGVPCTDLFAAIQAELLLGVDPFDSDVAGNADAVQHVKRKARVQNVQLQHLIAVCCSAAALHCRVEQLLLHTCAVAESELLALSTSATEAAADDERRSRKKTPAPQQVKASHLLLLAWCAAVMDTPQAMLQAKQLVAGTLKAVACGALSSLSETARGTDTGTASNLLLDEVLFGTPGIAARMFQLHVWLADRQVQAAQQQQPRSLLEEEPSAVNQAALGGEVSHRFDPLHQVAGASISAAEAEFSVGLGLSDMISHDQLQKAGQAWSRMQLAAASFVDVSHAGSAMWQLGAVAGALQQIPGIEGPRNMSLSPDGWVRIDVEAHIRDIPVAVLLLNDSEDASGGGVYAARWWVQEQYCLQDSARSESAELSLSQRSAAATNAGASARAARATERHAVGGDQQVRTLDVLQQSLACQHMGDVMFKARALAARGYWVVIVSCQDWSSLGGDPDAELAFLKDRLWLLLQESSSRETQYMVSSGTPVAAAAVIRDLGQAVDLEIS